MELRRHSPVPIATGEVLTRRQSFWPFLEQHAVDIIQPDCTKCGGLTEAWRIGWMAYEHNIQLVPHGWNTAIGLAADLHLTAALPVARYVEFLTPSPYMDGLVTMPMKPDAEGFLHLPTGPAWGSSSIARRSRSSRSEFLGRQSHQERRRRGAIGPRKVEGRHFLARIRVLPGRQVESDAAVLRFVGSFSPSRPP